jgi:hypothetical protein
MEKADKDRYDKRKEIFIKMLRDELGDNIEINEVRPVLSISDDWEINVKRTGKRKGHNIILSSELMTDENNDYLRKFKLHIAKLKKM